jgi:hypothetical protein
MITMKTVLLLIDLQISSTYPIYILTNVLNYSPNPKSCDSTGTCPSLGLANNT